MVMMMMVHARRWERDNEMNVCDDSRSDKE
jgi:hypothetical protein